jgi:hypothetical protein
MTHDFSFRFTGKKRAPDWLINWSKFDSLNDLDILAVILKSANFLPETT